MLHHERLKPPANDYPPDEWCLIEKHFRPEFMAQMETVLALGNGYFGMRGTPEEGSPYVQNGTFVNGFYESWPIVYAEHAFGFARTGQTMLNVMDTKIIKLFVDDEPFSLTGSGIRDYYRQLNMKSGTLDRKIIWETPSGRLVQINSRRLVSFQQRHVAAISYEVTLLNDSAPVVISSEMFFPQREEQKAGEADPRKAKLVSVNVLRTLSSYAKNRRIIICQATERSGMILGCGIDHEVESDCPYQYKTAHTENFGQVAFEIDAKAGRPIHLTKYMTYHTSKSVSPEEIGGRAQWTLDRVVIQGFPKLVAEQEQYMNEFWQRSDVRVNLKEGTTRLSTVEMQQAIRLNLFHILQASARADDTGVPAKGVTGQAYEGHYFWDTEIYLFPFLLYTSPRQARNLLSFRYRMLDQARTRAN